MARTIQDLISRSGRNLHLDGYDLEQHGFVLNNEQREMQKEKCNQAIFFKIPEPNRKIPQRDNYIDAMLVQTRGTIIEDNEYRCLMCIREIDDAGNEVHPGYGMFKDCVVWPGYMNNACGNCIWAGCASSCLYHKDVQAKDAKDERVQNEKARKKAADDARRKATIEKRDAAKAEAAGN